MLRPLTTVEANPRVGSFLVLYSAAVIGLESIQKLVSDFLGADEPVARAKSVGTGRVFRKVPRAIPLKVKRIAVNVGMLASLALSLVAAVLDLKKLHILTGAIFLVIFGTHLFERRRFLFA